MLCFEGIARMLNIFNHKATSPNYIVDPPVESIAVKEEVWLRVGEVQGGV